MFKAAAFWLQPVVKCILTSSLTCNNCFPYDFTNVISPKDVCKGEEEVTFAAIVTTEPKHNHSRRGVNILRLFQLLSKYGYDETFQWYQVRHCFPRFIPHRGLSGKGYQAGSMTRLSSRPMPLARFS